MFNFPFSSRIIAYASLFSTEANTSALESLNEFCRSTPLEVDIFAEEIFPDEQNRPLWQKILNLIDERKISVLVIPNLFHIAGNDAKALSSALDLLKAKGVTLQVLSDECGQGAI
jgi:DNA invertase Pin-like site-specific DNA recombinase